MIRKVSHILLVILLVFLTIPSSVFADSAEDEPIQSSPSTPATINDIFISRINYDDTNEYVQIYNPLDQDIEVDKLIIKFYNDQGYIANRDIDFGPGTILKKSFILLRRSLTGQDTLADKSYAGAYIPNSAAVRLFINDYTYPISGVCWISEPKCSPLPKADVSSGSALENICLLDDACLDIFTYKAPLAPPIVLEYGGFIPRATLPPSNNSDEPTPDDNHPIVSPCSLIKINEISFADSHKFIEFINESPEAIDTSNCAFKRGAAKSNLDRAAYLNAIFKPGEIKTFNIADTAITQSNANVAIAIYDKLNDQMVKVEDENGDEIVYQVQYTKVKENASYAWFDDEERTGWFQTFAPTPGTENIYQQFQNCPTGKMINPDTGNCVNIPLPPADCLPGQYRNPETGRCKKLPEETIYVPCQEGYYRNQETNRCRKIEAETSLKECQEGWERNPETNRCRKKADNSPAGFAIQNSGPTPESNMLVSFASGGAAITGTLITASYRQDFMNFIRKFTRKK